MKTVSAGDGQRTLTHTRPFPAIIGGSTRKGSTVNTFVSMLKDDEAQGLVEYALIIALVSIIAIAALKFLGGKASNTLNNAANSLSN